MKICIAGKNEIAVHGLQLAISAIGRENVLICKNNNDDGISKWQPSLVRFAREWGVKVVDLFDLYKIEDLLFISLEFDQIIRPDRFSCNKLFNIHFSKLPAYKGMYTSAWPILNGEGVSGVTLHEIDHGIDTGNIIDQMEISIDVETTARDLYFSYIDSAKLLLDRSFSSLFFNTYKSSIQSAFGSTYYSKKSINYSNINLDFNNTACFVKRQIKAFQFREFQMPSIEGFLIGDVEILEERSCGKPGSFKMENDDSLILNTIDYDMKLKRDESQYFFKLVEAGVDTGIACNGRQELFLNIRNARGWTPLIMAAYRGDVSLCRALVNIGADIEMSNQNGTTPLMYAKDYGVRTGDFTLCRFLMDAGANLHTKDRFNRSVIDYSIINSESASLNFFGINSKG